MIAYPLMHILLLVFMTWPIAAILISPPPQPITLHTTPFGPLQQGSGMLEVHYTLEHTLYMEAGWSLIFAPVERQVNPYYSITTEYPGLNTRLFGPEVPNTDRGYSIVFNDSGVVLTATQSNMLTSAQTNITCTWDFSEMILSSISTHPPAPSDNPNIATYLALEGAVGDMSQWLRVGGNNIVRVFDLTKLIPFSRWTPLPPQNHPNTPPLFFVQGVVKVQQPPDVELKPMIHLMWGIHVGLWDHLDIYSCTTRFIQHIPEYPMTPDVYHGFTSGMGSTAWVSLTNVTWVTTRENSWYHYQLVLALPYGIPMGALIRPLCGCLVSK